MSRLSTQDNRRFQTFFLCTKRWSDVDGLISFVRWIVPLVTTDTKQKGLMASGPKCVLVARRPEHFGRHKVSYSGDYFKFEHQLDKKPLQNLVIVSGTGVQFNLAVEFLHMQLAPETATSETTPVCVPDGIKTYSISIISSIWEKYLRTNVAVEIRQRWKHLFITSGALYGYEGRTSFPKTGHFNLIESSETPPLPRIIDFDYSRFIEDAFPANYLSKSLLDPTGSRDRILSASGRLTREVLRDESNDVGVLLKAMDESSEATRDCRELLRDLIWRPA